MAGENGENLRAWLKSWDFEAWNRGESDMSLVDPEVAYEDTALPDRAHAEPSVVRKR